MPIPAQEADVQGIGQAFGGVPVEMDLVAESVVQFAPEGVGGNFANGPGGISVEQGSLAMGQLSQLTDRLDARSLR